MYTNWALLARAKAGTELIMAEPPSPARAPERFCSLDRKWSYRGRAVTILKPCRNRFGDCDDHLVPIAKWDSVEQIKALAPHGTRFGRRFRLLGCSMNAPASCVTATAKRPADISSSPAPAAYPDSRVYSR
jgi:hypothetical protein